MKKRRGAKHGLASMQFPQVVIPAVSIPQPDGSLVIRPGKPAILADRVGTREAARILGMSPRWVELECYLGRFTTARKPGLMPKSRWSIARAEILARKAKPE
jgi:hypothetical protein